MSVSGECNLLLLAQGRRGSRLAAKTQVGRKAAKAGGRQAKGVNSGSGQSAKAQGWVRGSSTTVKEGR